MSESDQVERLLRSLRRLESDLVERTARASQRSRRVENLVRALAVIMGALALSNLYFVNDLTQEVRAAIANMDEMTDYFDRVSATMSAIRQTVSGMQDHVAVMPVVTAQTREIAGRMDSMRDSVTGLNATTTTLKHRMDVMNLTVVDMAHRFRSLNQSVGLMGRDVNQMSRPVP
jgi:methyl-accepting chemotaxis protein